MPSGKCREYVLWSDVPRDSLGNPQGRHAAAEPRQDAAPGLACLARPCLPRHHSPPSLLLPPSLTVVVVALAATNTAAYRRPRRSPAPSPVNHRHSLPLPRPPSPPSPSPLPCALCARDRRSPLPPTRSPAATTAPAAVGAPLVTPAYAPPGRASYWRRTLGGPYSRGRRGKGKYHSPSPLLSLLYPVSPPLGILLTPISSQVSLPPFPHPYQITTRRAAPPFSARWYATRRARAIGGGWWCARIRAHASSPALCTSATAGKREWGLKPHSLFPQAQNASRTRRIWACSIYTCNIDCK